jgi:hypothetical protein
MFVQTLDMTVQFLDNTAAIGWLPNKTVPMMLVTYSLCYKMAAQLHWAYGTLELACDWSLVVLRSDSGSRFSTLRLNPHGSAILGVAMAEPSLAPLRHEK